MRPRRTRFIDTPFALLLSMVIGFGLIACVTDSESPLESRIYEINEYAIVSMETASTILGELDRGGVELSRVQAVALSTSVFSLLQTHHALGTLMQECKLAGGFEFCDTYDYINQAIVSTSELARLVTLLAQEAK